jgi:hypothetical protein
MNLSGTENCSSLWPTFNAKIATYLAPLLCKLAFVFPLQDLSNLFSPRKPVSATSFFLRKKGGAGLVVIKSETDWDERQINGCSSLFEAVTKQNEI